MSNASATSAAAKGATYLIALQVSSRALTFVLNQALLRFLTPDTLGRAVQLELFSISVLFFARESLRVAVQRVDGTKNATQQPTPDQDGTNATSVHEATDKKENGAQRPSSTGSNAVQTVVNLSYIPLLLGFPLTLILGLLTQRALQPSTSPPQGDSSHISLAIMIYGAAALIELAAEPAFGVAQTLLLFKVRAGAEAAATVAKTVATVGAAVVAHRARIDAGVLPFAAGQLAFAVALWAVYIWRVGNRSSGGPTGEAFTLLPRRLDVAKPESGDGDLVAGGYLSRRLLALAASLSLQSGVKYVLTQGDSLLVAALVSLQDQGTYALAANYGGLIARMLFQPIEEASRTLFAKLCATAPTQAESEKSKTVESANGSAAKPPQASREAGPARAAHILTLLLHLYALLALPALTLGPSLAPPLLSLIAGPRWTALGAGAVLGTYAYYIPLLAFNGLLEAFVSATADAAELGRQSAAMAVCSAFFAASAFVFVSKAPLPFFGAAGLGLGARGVVYANCVNMAGRILWAAAYATRYLRSRGVEVGVRAVLPGAGSVGVAAVVPFLLRATNGALVQYGTVGELARVGGVAGLLLFGIAASELGFFRECYGLLRRNPAQKPHRT